jgi:hypothetical protein
MDVHVPFAICAELRLRGVDVLTAQEDRSDRLVDSAVLDRASVLGRILFTRDEDLLGEAARRQQSATPFAGIVYAHQLRVSPGECVLDLELIAKASGPEDWMSRVEYLPL